MSSPFLVELVAQRMYASHRSCDTTAKRDGSERDDKDGTHGITVEKCRYCVYMHSLLRKRKRACGSKHHSRVTRTRASACSASINVFGGRAFPATRAGVRSWAHRQSACERLNIFRD